jgi:hypothetical protein
LQQVVALLVASHYKNTPNDLLLMADAPAHGLFVLLPPVDETRASSRRRGRGRPRGGGPGRGAGGRAPRPPGLGGAPFVERGGRRRAPFVPCPRPVRRSNPHLALAPPCPSFFPQTPTPQNALPDVLAVVQVALEGAISAKAAQSSLARGELPQGDLIPWTVGQQYQARFFSSAGPGGEGMRRALGFRGRRGGAGRGGPPPPAAGR